MTLTAGVYFDPSLGQRDWSEPLYAGGQALIGRTGYFTNTGVGVNSGHCRFSYFRAARSETVSTAYAVSGTQAAATVTLIRFGLYTEASNGDLTLVASTANDTSLFGSTNTQYSKALSSSYALVRGQRYAYCWLFVGTTAPTLLARNFQSAGIGTEWLRAPAISSLITGQTDLPGSVANGVLGANGATFYTALI